MPLSAANNTMTSGGGHDTEEMVLVISNVLYFFFFLIGFLCCGLCIFCRFCFPVCTSCRDIDYSKCIIILLANNTLFVAIHFFFSIIFIFTM